MESLISLSFDREVYASELEILFGAANRSTSTADDFSQLSKVAHHYCDSFSDLSANGMVDKSRNRLVSEEVVIVRNSLLKLVDEKVVSLRAQLAQVDSNLQQKDSHSKDSLLSAKETRRLLSTQLVMMLKRAAECGNDLFGVTENFEDKLRIGQYVLDITQVML